MAGPHSRQDAERPTSSNSWRYTLAYLGSCQGRGGSPSCPRIFMPVFREDQDASKPAKRCFDPHQRVIFKHL